MKAINLLDKKVKLFRPLLDIKKKNLKQISKKIFGKYINDPANKNQKFLRSKNYDLSNLSSKNFDIFIDSKIKIHHIVTVCNNANNEICPILPKNNQIIHWDIEDPLIKLNISDEREKNKIILNTFNAINKKIIKFFKNESK